MQSNIDDKSEYLLMRMIKVNFSAKCDIDIYFDVPIMSASVANEFDCRSTFEYINRNNLSPCNRKH